MTKIFTKVNFLYQRWSVWDPQAARESYDRSGYREMIKSKKDFSNCYSKCHQKKSNFLYRTWSVWDPQAARESYDR
ncbi:hypothetical protein Fmac_003663 [Flemingia macrophylla]|uniref:Uncharacterized protein n=1 Tax=Flemingia macrophylla TaxID=520843 RepID=A0ABD1N415_9FABA